MTGRKVVLNWKSKIRRTTGRLRLEWMEQFRHATELGLAAFLLYTGVVYNSTVTGSARASIDALNPLGGLETVWRWLVIGGQSVSKTQLSNVVLGIGLFIGVLYAGITLLSAVSPLATVQSA